MASNDTPANGPALPATTLFQKAHARMVTLARIDEQLSALIEQRRKVQEELRSVQVHINEEFDRMMKQADETPAKLLAQIADSVKSENGFNGRLVAADAAA